ncbi:hypothetical protein WN944_017128 [Citrus x changshan-huyou]|uniref:GATA-type domain-containing protein n=1 Tax=Citrus x changshan-huyou TaxID=2935761 RepID=A0AAP0QP91_9ROSI
MDVKTKVEKELMIKSPFALKKQRREAKEMMKSSPAGTFNEMKKSCTDCHTTRTPLWRGGPAGPRSLCNACGIRYRKTKKRALLGRDKGRAQKRKRKYSSNSNNHKGATKLGISLKAGLMAVVGSDMGEEEQAAILLMSLSYGCLYA